ncbi:MAG: hypothetical protein JXR61_00210 [Prolixibacteraceae bacterium]|nr:hypothetical protein [Prolixibacteraceae bacterium]
MKQIVIFVLRGLLFYEERKNIGHFLHDKFFENTKDNEGNRKIMFTLNLLLFFFTSFSANSNKSTARYSMHFSDIEIGEFFVSQMTNSQKVTIEAITDVKINFPFSYRIKYIQKTVYDQGVLQSSHVETHKNGKLSSIIHLKREDGIYLLNNNGDTTIVRNSITYSGSLVYFNEPKGVENIYKERSAEIKQVIPIDEHVYIIRNKKGKEINRYCYKDGILQYAKMQHALGTIELNRMKTDQTND